MVLLEKNWKSLLLLNLVHCAVPIHMAEDIDILLTIETANKGLKLTDELNSFYLDNFKQVKDIYLKLNSLKLDSYEYSSFKLIVLLRTGKFYKIFY